MKAARFHGTSPKLVIEEINDPVPLPGSAVIEVEATFIFGSLRDMFADPSIWMLPPVPFVPGMDTVGRVVAVADDVTGLALGDRVYCDHWYRSHNVSAEPDGCFLGCFGVAPGAERHMARWRDGGFAEKLMLPAECMTPLGDAGDKASAAQLCRLGWLGTAYGAFRKVGLGSGESVIVTGASGLVGASGVLIALAMGATRVVAVGRTRAKLDAVAACDPRVAAVALDGGAQDAEAVREAVGSRGADVVLDAVAMGADGAMTAAAIAALAPRGRVVMVGGGYSAPPALPYDRIVYEDMTVRGSLWFPREAAAEMLAMIAAGTLDLSAVAAESVALDGLNAAIAEAATGSTGLRHFACCPNKG